MDSAVALVLWHIKEQKKMEGIHLLVEVDLTSVNTLSKCVLDGGGIKQHYLD